jgi:hypothetical protein
MKELFGVYGALRRQNLSQYSSCMGKLSRAKIAEHDENKIVDMIGKNEIKYTAYGLTDFYPIFDNSTKFEVATKTGELWSTQNWPWR